MVNIQAGKVSNLKNTMFYLFLVVLFFFLCGCCSVEQQIKLNIIGVWTRLCEIWKSYKPQKRKDSFKHLGHSTAVEYVRCVNLCMTGGEHERQLHVCSNCQLKAPLSMPFVVVSRSSILLLLLLVCVSSTITGQPQNSIFVRSIGLAETTSQDKPAFSFVRGQDSTMWDKIVWVLPQGHRSVSVSRHFLLQAPQCPCSVRKRSSRDHCCRGISKPGCRIVGSLTRWELTTWTDFQSLLLRESDSS